jgi:hypothetical protein
VFSRSSGSQTFHCDPGKVPSNLGKGPAI